MNESTDPQSPDASPKDASPKLDRWRSRPFPEGRTPDARYSIAITLSKRAGHDHIPRRAWADAGAIERALRQDGFTIRRVKP